MEKQLTKAEEEIMQILWVLNEGNVKDLIEKFPEPKPAYNTVSTIIRILETKGFVDHRQEGKGYIYFPLIKKTDYSNFSMKKLVDNYFQGSFKNMVSFLVKKKDIDLEDVEKLLEEIKKEEHE